MSRESGASSPTTYRAHSDMKNARAMEQAIRMAHPRKLPCMPRSREVHANSNETSATDTIAT